jgi:hypothetical protein
MNGLASADLKDGPPVFEAAPQMQGQLDDLWTARRARA